MIEAHERKGGTSVCIVLQQAGYGGALCTPQHARLDDRVTWGMKRRGGGSNTPLKGGGRRVRSE